jgi:hypothetical protein
MEKLNFCTLFNANYLTRGLVLYRSLLATCPDFHLYVFAFDDKTYEYLRSLKEEKLTVISLEEFEDPELLRVKPTRSAAEYCWTCTPSTILYALKTFQLSNCTYIDADMCFYSDPSVLVREMNGKSVLITDHRYTKAYDQTATSGKYCVQFVTAFNNPQGLEVMNWWRNACIEWCYARLEDGKFGDQKYLDDWPTRFSSVHELQHPGGGVAPWNVQQYTFSEQGGKIRGYEISTGRKFEVVFFHYHGLKFFDKDVVSLTEARYAISKEVQDLFFIPYVRRLMQAKREVMQRDSNFNPNGSSGPSPYPVSRISAGWRYYKESLQSGRRYLLGQKVGKSLQHHYFRDARKL